MPQRIRRARLGPTSSHRVYTRPLLYPPTLTNKFHAKRSSYARTVMHAFPDEPQQQRLREKTENSTSWKRTDGYLPASLVARKRRQSRPSMIATRNPESQYNFQPNLQPKPPPCLNFHFQCQDPARPGAKKSGPGGRGGGEAKFAMSLLRSLQRGVGA